MAEGASLALSGIHDDAEPVSASFYGATGQGAIISTASTLTVFPGPITFTDDAGIGGSNSAGLVLTGNVTSHDTLLKLGTGTVALAADNTATLTGDIAVNMGTLALPVAGALGGVESISVGSVGGIGNIGTLLLETAGNLDRIRDAAPIFLGPGSTILKGSGASEGSALTDGLGVLFLGGNATLDFGTGGVGTLTFEDFAPGAFLLLVSNWTGTPGVAGTDGIDDRLIFNADQTANLGAFSFAGSPAQQVPLSGGYFEIVPVPEPSAAALLAAACGALALRRRRA